MAKNWTPAQRAAMDITDKTLLVSAAAGSGKTATLTQRIINRLTDSQSPSDISSMLIVTFTHAAADELKNRIFLALSEELAKSPANKHLTSQLIKLGNARICTIDAFYLELIRANFSILGISPSFRIADPVELELLSIATMEETIERFYEENDTFPALAECLIGTRNAKQLSTILLKLSDKSASLPEGIEFLLNNARKTEKQAEEGLDFLSTDFGEVLRSEAIDIVTHYKAVFDAACTFASDPDLSPLILPSYSYDRDFTERLLLALSHPTEGYERTRAMLASFAPVRMKNLKDAATEESERFKKLRTKIHADIRKLYQKSFEKPSESIFRAMKDTARYTEILYRLLYAYETKMNEEKKRRNILTFNDIRRLTLKLLVNGDGTPTEIAKQYAKEFTDIYIDEYQDVDRVQDLIFRSIAKPTNRFMVGDIKQSIYGFRGAEPSLFAEYRASFPPYGGEDASSDSATIFMSENFRCDSNVIDFTNMICSRIFYACGESIGYCPEDDLRFAKALPAKDYASPCVEVTVLSSSSEDDSPSEEEEPKAKEIEAEYIAREIERLIRTEKKADGSPIQAGDIAVLFRSRSMSAYLTDALHRRGILTSESDGERYFESPDVLMVLCLLNTVDNPHRDIFLTGTLTSPLFGFHMNDILAIRASADPSYSLYDALLACKEGDSELSAGCRSFDQTLNEYRALSAALSVDRFLRHLFESDLFTRSGFVTSQSETGEGGNLLRLYEYARSFEAGSFKGLYNFIEFINTLIEEGKKLKIPPKGISPERVNLMTIHQSKGLEFPVCFVCNAGGQFNKNDQRASLLFEYPVGVAMKLSDTTGFARINTPMREALSARNAIRQREEEMRVLYVALTRARERLYVTASTARNSESLMAAAQKRAAFCTRHAIMSASSYLDWILIPFADESTRIDCAKLTFLESVMEENLPHEGDTAVPEEKKAAALIDDSLYETLREKYAFRYSYGDLQRIPAKLSVSRLSPNVLDDTNDARDLFPEQKKTAIPDFFLSRGIHQPTAAERGTATHLFLQFCDFSLAYRSGAKEELARLVEKGFLPRNYEELVYLDELDAFLQSDFCKQIRGARRIIREQRFNLLMDAEHFTADPKLKTQLEDAKLAVQGVIDLIVFDSENRLCLFDYKTDRLTREELSDEKLAAKRMNELHGLQLSYYAHAAEQLFGVPCHRLCVYSTHSATLYDVIPHFPDDAALLLDIL